MPKLSNIDDDDDYQVDMRRLEEEDLTPKGIERQNELLLDRQRRFRHAADMAVEAWSPFDEVRAVALIGSVARPLWKEVPRFQPYRRARVKLWHECADLDLALWLSALDRLGSLRKALAHALSRAVKDAGFGVTTEQVDAFIFEPGSDRYVGRLCRFNQCPKGKRDCLAPECGRQPFLKQVEGFRPYADILTPERTEPLFERNAGVLRCAAELPTANKAAP